MTIPRILKFALPVFCLILLAGIISCFRLDPVKTPPSFERIRETYKKSDALLLDRYGRTIYEMRIDHKGRRLAWIELKDISPALVRVVLQMEDRRFYEHHGVDWRALGSSLLSYPDASKRRGASTITMQVAALLDKKLKPRRARRNFNQKLNQIRAARMLEQTWSKAQILEAYLNLISYRTELQGIAAASRGLFQKDPNGLNDIESLILASLIASPNAPVDRVIQKSGFYGRSLGLSIPADKIKQAAQEVLQVPYHLQPSADLAPQAARLLLKGNEPRVYSTLDARMQQRALEILNHHINLIKESNVNDGAILVADNQTGEILVYVGNRGQASSASEWDGITALRQAGSTLKPFLYQMAIEKRLLTAASLLDDSPLQVPTASGIYVPQNYDHIFRGPVSLRLALSSSINIPAVRTLMLVGLDPFAERLKALGLNSLTEDGEYYGYSLALGSADITLWELTNAYRTLANQGKWSPLKLALKQKNEKPKQVFDKNSDAVIAHILSDREARSATFGLENVLSTRFWTAVKTGTSKDMRDNWCLGYSEKYTVGVWVGNFSGAPMRNVSGVSGAAPIWLEVMNMLHADRPSRPPRPPEGVIMAEVSFD
ncbi:MAG TPA: penicillin-binding protein 1C, partial [Thermodesulfobacteriota bacterium]|nr:penicillin-binding protein 1C [Thermodesulfobacteriota bacterium]